MLFYLIGILEDGTTRAPLVPSSPPREIRFAQGESVIISLCAMTSSGVPVSTTDRTVTLTARKAVGDTFPALEVEGVVDPGAGRGCWTFTIPTDTTRKLLGGDYVYDVVSVKAGERETLVAAARMFVTVSPSRAS